MNDNREFCIRTVLEMLVELRSFKFNTLLHEQASYLCGFLAGLMYADVIDRAEFKRLCKLVSNAQWCRDAELAQPGLRSFAA